MSNINFTYPDEPQQNIVEVRFNSTKEGDKGDKGDKGDRGPRGYGITKVAPIDIKTGSGQASTYGVYGKDDEGNEIIYTTFSVYNGKDVTAQELPIIGTEPITVNRDADNNYVIGFNYDAMPVGWKLRASDDTIDVSPSIQDNTYYISANISDTLVRFKNDNDDIFGSFTLNQIGNDIEVNITNHIIGRIGSFDMTYYENGNWVELPPAENSLLVGYDLNATHDNCVVIGTKNSVNAEYKTNIGAGYRDCLFSIGNGYTLNPGTENEETELKTVFTVDTTGDIYADLTISKETEDVFYRDVAISYLIEKMYTTINEVVDMVNAIKNGQLTPGTADLSKINILDYMGFRVGWNNKNELITHVPKNN